MKSSPSWWQIGSLAVWLSSLGTFAAYEHARDQHLEGRLRATSAQIATLGNAITRLAEAPPPSCAPSIVQAPIDVDALARRTADAVALQGGAPSRVPPETAPAAPKEDTPEQLEALSRAQAALDAAIARGTLERGDMREIRRNLAGANPEEAAALRKQVAVAINTAKVKVTRDPGPP